MYIKRGFTLIELLVVIAIIGVLSAVVLASLNTARSKGNDAGVKSNLHTVETQSAVYADDNHSFGTFDDGAGAAAPCPTPADSGTSLFHNTTVESAIAAALLDSGGGTAMCLADGAAYAVAVSRPADTATTTTAYWCVDSAQNHCGVNSNALTGVSFCTCVSSN
jgi:prepilin-type N-terminal cleavage/methylation domain-containing protein